MVHIRTIQAVGMAENEASTMAAPLPTSTAAFPQTAPATYPASAPTIATSPWATAAAPVAAPAPTPGPTSAEAVPEPGVPVEVAPTGVGAPGEILRSSRNDPPRNDVLSRMRTPAVAAAAGGVLVLAVGFGAGFVVGRDHAGAGSTAGVQGGTGANPGGGTGFGGRGQGQQGFGGPTGQQGTNGQSQQGTDGIQPGADGQGLDQSGTDGTTGTTGTTNSTGLDQFQ